MTTDEYQQRVSVGQAWNLSMQYALLQSGAQSLEQVLDAARKAVPSILEVGNIVQAEHAFQAPAQPAQQFTPPPPPAAAPSPQAQAAPVAPPAPLPGVTEDPTEALWREYFADPSGWFDNRGNKNNPKSPDFKKKKPQGAPADMKTPGLWIADSKTPAWVRQALG